MIFSKSGTRVSERIAHIFAVCNPKEIEPNARLIAAAPEMLETLKGALRYLEKDLSEVGYGSDEISLFPIVAEIEATISKAEGRT
jgi:hypothetical protein